MQKIGKKGLNNNSTIGGNKMKSIGNKVSSQSNSFNNFRKEYYSKNPEDISLLKEALIEEFNETEDMKIEELLTALKEVMKLEGIAKAARKTRLNRENLHRTFSAKGNPTVKTVSKIIEYLGYKVQLVPIANTKSS